jgi:outer membrane protein assembly factor BamB
MRPLLASMVVVVTATGFLTDHAACAGSWSQFRGPNATGRAPEEAPLPVEIGPESHVVWKVPLPPGHSSPAIHADRIYVTGERDGKLLTIALDRRTGATLWEVAAAFEKLEEVHSVGSHATPTPATDGERIVSFFGSAGLFCYDLDGKLLWKIPMGPFKNDFGSGSSPILVDDRVLLCQDHDVDSFLMAIDKRTGAIIWRVDRSEFPRNYCTPVIWNVEGKKQVVVAATLRIVGYDFDTGEEVWTVRGVARIVNMTPVVGDDNILYAACWSPGGDETDRIATVPFADVVSQVDANGNGAIDTDEAPEGTVKMRFTQMDRNKDGRITAEEYESMRRVFETARNGILAIRPGGTGEITDSHVLWRFNKLLPYCPSPVYYQGRLFMIKDGGILTVLDAATGQPLKQGRIKANGGYYSSPVAGDGKVYTASQLGQVTVLKGTADAEQLHSIDFGENIFASPAIVDGRIYLRTSGHLYCFGTE